MRTIAIVGPTASGKTELALRLAQHFPAEIVCADSRTIYCDLDIGTAKPSPVEQAAVRHYGLDIVQPDQPFSAAQFQRLARQWLAAIHGAGKTALIVGGTGLYVQGLLYDFAFAPPGDEARRAELEAMDILALQAYCRQHGVALPENQLNKRYLVRAIERHEAGSSPQRHHQLPTGTRLIGLNPGPEVLRQRIAHRAEQMFSGPIVAEAEAAARRYGWDAPGLTGNIYPIIRALLAGELSCQQAIEQFITADWRLAKRQLTWWRRDEHVEWFDSPEAAERTLCYNEHTYD